MSHCLGVWRNACPPHQGLRVPHAPPCPSQPRCCVGTKEWVDRVGAALHAWPKMLARGTAEPGLALVQLSLQSRRRLGQGWIPVLRTVGGTRLSGHTGWLGRWLSPPSLSPPCVPSPRQALRNPGLEEQRTG